MALVTLWVQRSEFFDATTTPFSRSGTSSKYHMWNPPLVDWTVKKSPQRTPQINDSQHFTTSTFRGFGFVTPLFSWSGQRRTNHHIVIMVKSGPEVPSNQWLSLHHGFDVHIFWRYNSSILQKWDFVEVPYVKPSTGWLDSQEGFPMDSPNQQLTKFCKLWHSRFLAVVKLWHPRVQNPWSSEANNNLAPFRLAQGSQTLVIWVLRKSSWATRLTLGWEFFKDVGTSPWSHRWKVWRVWPSVSFYKIIPPELSNTSNEVREYFLCFSQNFRT